MKYIGMGVTIWLLGVSSIASANKSDFNKDGKPDILRLNQNTQAFEAWYMNGVTRIDVAPINGYVSAGWQVVGENDFDGDGNTDILWHDGGSTGKLQIWYMNGTSLSTVGIFDEILDVLDSTGWKVVGTDDFNQDGHPDILWQNAGTGDCQVWFMNGTRLLGYASLDGIPDPIGWQIVGTGDFDQDGRPDVLRYKGTSGAIEVLYMDGATVSFSASFISGLNTPATLGWSIVGVDDFDGDGHPDLLWHRGTVGDSLIWFMNDRSRLSALPLAVESFSDASGWRIVD